MDRAPTTARVEAPARGVAGGGAEEPDELPKVTAAHLRRAGSLCPRRLALEHEDRRSMRLGAGRFRVPNRLVEDARLTHVDLAPPTAAHFRPGDDLSAEERRLYETAARWYVSLYQHRPVRSVDLDLGGGACDTWSSRVETLGVRLVGRCGLTVEDAEATPEVRVLRLGRGLPPGALLDDVDVRFTILRLAAWAPDALVVSVADLVHGARHEELVDVAAARTELDAWLEERVALVRARAADGRPVPGLDCGTCKFVPGCKAHA